MGIEYIQATWLEIKGNIMIKVKDLISWLIKVDDDAEVYAYEGEDTGLVIRDLDHSCKFIRASRLDDDSHVEGFDE
jgi:hypothetical protein